MSFTTNDWDAAREKHIAEHHDRVKELRAADLVGRPDNVVDFVAIREAKRRLRLIRPTHHDGGTAA